MIRTTKSKIRHLCMLAFVPRLFRGNIRYVPGNFEKLSLSGQKTAYKSTSSWSKEEGESEDERCQKIIDRVFAPNVPYTETIFTDFDPKTTVLSRMSSGPPNNESSCEICKRLIKVIFDDEGKVIENKTEVKPHLEILQTAKAKEKEEKLTPTIEAIEETPILEEHKPITLQATTAKDNEEKLTQKIEVIDETPLVEAHKPKVEGFNVIPKVLGGKEKEITLNAKEIEILNFSSNKNINNRDGSIKKGDTNYDELAKRCLNSPSGQIDERLLKEMEKLGVPPSGRNSKKNLDENEFIQAEIMKKPRRPVEKTDLDLLSVKKNKDSEKGHVPVSRSIRNSMIICREKTNKHYPKRHSGEGLTNSFNHISSNEESRRLLGHMAATSISGDDGTKTTDSTDSELLNNSGIKDINLVDHVSVTIEESTKPLTPPSKVTLEERRNQQIIQNLLRTRIEHLIHDKVKSVKSLLEDNSNIISKTNIQNYMKSAGSDVEDPFVRSIETAKSKGDETIKESYKQQTVDGGLNNDYDFSDKESPQKLENYNYSEPMQDIYGNFSKLERVTPAHILYNSGITTEERSSLPHPGLVIREYIEFGMSPTTSDETQTETKQTTAPAPPVTGDKSKQYQMKGEPTVYKSNVYRKYIEYIQNSQQRTISKSNVYSPYNDIQNDEPKPVKSESTEESSELESQYTSFVIKEKQPVKEEPIVDQSKETESTPQPSMNEGFAVDKSNFSQNAYDSQSGQNVSTQAQPAMDQSNIYNQYNYPQSENQQQMEQYPNTNQNYIYNQYTNYMHSAQQPAMNTQDIDPSNVYNQYSYVENKNEPTLPAEPIENKNIEPGQETGEENIKKDKKDEPIIVAETGRSQTPTPDDKLKATAVKDPVTNTVIPSENLVKPLIDKGTLAHVANEAIQTQIPPVEVPAPSPVDTMTLSQLLKRVRERNRMEYCRQFELYMQSATQTDPAVGKCGKKPPPCPPPAPTCPPIKPKCPPPVPTCPPCPPPPKPPCPPPQPPCPNPCKPKCPPPCTPNPCAPKPACPPPKESPCDKFKCKCSLPIEDAFAFPIYNNLQLISDALKNEAKDVVASKVRKVCNVVFLTGTQNEIESTVMIDNVEYARTYHPWSPIPSWPIPKRQEKKKLVCPKDGCKDAPPRLNPPCSDINPCINFPKPNSLTKRSFSIIDRFFMALIKTSP